MECPALPRFATFLVLLAALASLPAGAQTVLSRDQEFHRTDPAGQTLRVFTYTRYHHDCRPAELPRIELRDQPAHGTVAVHDAPITVGAVREGEADCTGRTYPGVGIWYTPAPGFRGTDRFGWNVVGTRVSHDSVVIDVQ